MPGTPSVFRSAFAPGLLFLLLLAALPARAEDRPRPLVVAYLSRPPYHYAVNGAHAGEIYERTARVLDRAGLNATFQEVPYQRILDGLRRPGSRLCTFGWHKTEDREAFARFSLPIFEDAPLVAVALAGLRKRLGAESSLAAILTTPGITVGLVQGWSYGDYVDGMARKYASWVLRAPSQAHMAAMLANGRFSCALLRATEVEAFLRNTGLSPGAFEVLPLHDLRERGRRYILCGRGVPESVMARIDAAIRELGLPGGDEPEREGQQPEAPRQEAPEPEARTP
jgi:polar amino acid transport system substrate-binding protein